VALGDVDSDGWADVWKRGCFGWENKKPGRDLATALHQLTDYTLKLENPPLLVVSDRERIIIHTAFTGYPDEPREIRIEELIDPEKLQILRWCIYCAGKAGESVHHPGAFIVKRLGDGQEAPPVKVDPWSDDGRLASQLAAEWTAQCGEEDPAEDPEAAALRVRYGAETGYYVPEGYEHLIEH
jgi:hypothetical protein